MRLDHDIEALATRQHALVATFQLYGLGATATEVSRLRSGGRGWHPVTERVLARTGGAETLEQRLMAAVLDASPGAVLAATTAAHLWGAPGFRPAPLHVTRHRGVSRRPSRLAKVHEVVDLRPHHVRLLHGIPVTSPGRTVFDLASVVHPGRVERFLDWCWSERLLDGRALLDVVVELAKRGRTGSTLLRELVAARGIGYTPPASGLERRFEQVLGERALGAYRRQVDSGGEAWTGRVDYRHRELPIVVEVHSERYHTALLDQAHDRSRQDQLGRDGFEVVVVWDVEVWHEPDTVVARVRAAEELVRARRRAAS
jgi:very-short-patch-repair endonuclease